MGWTLFGALGIASIVGFLAVLLAATLMAPGASYGMMGGAGWVWGGFVMAAVALVLVVIVIALIGALRQPSASFAYPAYAPAPRSAFEVLEERYARGELNREDYLKIRGDLTHGPSQP